VVALNAAALAWLDVWGCGGSGQWDGMEERWRARLLGRGRAAYPNYFLVFNMALSSLFKRINVKYLTSKVSVYTSATSDDFGSLPYYLIHLTTSA
jgi:hypothetical protein